MNKKTKNLIKYQIFWKTILVAFFFVGFLLFGTNAMAATVTWDGGGGDGLWETATNWSSDTIPTSDDDVTVTGVVTLSSGQTANFKTLAIGNGVAATELILTGNIGSGSTTTVTNSAILTQNNAVQQTLTQDLVVLSGGILRHSTNTTSQLYVVNFSANNINIQSGGSVNVDGRGFSGGATDISGNGTGAGIFDGGLNWYSSGGSHGGDGGKDVNNTAGGIAYCDPTALNTIGSGGGGGAIAIGGGAGGNGGGLIIFNAVNTLTVNGTISANGTDGAWAAGGGAGGGVKLSAATVNGTPESFSINGGIAISGNAGGGGGGCVSVIYTNSVTFTSSTVLMNGGSGYQKGGAGQFYLKSGSSNGDLFVINNATGGASTTQTVASLTLNSLVVNKGNYLVTSTRALTFSGNSDPFVNSGDSGKVSVGGTVTLNANIISGAILQIINGGVYINSTTLNIESTGGFRIDSGGSINNVFSTINTSGTLYISYGSTFSISNSLMINSGTTTVAYFTTSTPLSIPTVIVNGGILTHETNTNSQAHVLNVSSTNMTIGVGGSINLDGKGYSGGAASSDGNGVGPGLFDVGGGFYSSGGAHGGAGGNDSNGTLGGVAYCTTANQVGQTIGSGGGGGSSDIGGGAGGNGGGLAKLNISNTFTINGTITAVATAGGWASSGGAGGGVGITAGVVTGTPVIISVKGSDGVSNSGGGGGGCARISYHLTTSVVTSTVTTTAGTGFQNGADGSVFIVQYNTSPTTTINTVSQNSSTTVNFTTTVSDADFDITSLAVQYSTDNSTWNNATLGAVSVSSGSVATSSGSVASIDTNVGAVTVTGTWQIFSDVSDTDDTTVYLRLIPNDSYVDGTTNTSSAFSVDTKQPTMPGNLGATAVSTSSLRFLFPNTTSTDTNFFEYKIFYSTSTPVTTAGTALTSSTDSNLSSSTFRGATSSTLITGLSASTTYYFVLYAYDIWGNATSSAEGSTTTLSAAVSTNNAPTGVATSSISTNSISITWTAPSPSGVETYFVVERSTDNTSYTQIATTTTSTLTHNFTGLSLNTRYWFRVASGDGTNSTSSYSTTSPAYTLAAVPSAPTVDGATTSTLNITVNENSNPVATNFSIQETNSGNYVQADGTLGVSEIFDTDSNWGTKTITGLSVNTQYTFKVRAKNGDNTTTTQSSASSKYTLANPASTPTIGAPTSSTIPITINTNSNPAATTYSVVNTTTGQYLDSSGTVTTTQAFYTSSTWNNASATGLTPSTSYQFVVVSRNGDSVTAATSSASTATSTQAALPTNPTVTNLTSSTLTLTWGQSNNPTNVIYQISASGFTTTTVTATTTNLTGLTPNTSYTFTLKAQNPDTSYTAGVAATATTTLPAAPGIPIISSLSTSTLTLTFTSSTNPNTTVYQIIGNNSFTSVTTTAVSLGLTGLISNTSYQFQVRAQSIIDSSVYSSYSASSTATTTVVNGNNTPTNLTATADSTTKITLTWSGDSAEYLLTNNLNSTNSGWITDTNYSFTNLSCSTNYSFSLKGRDVGLTETASVSISKSTNYCINIIYNNGGTSASNHSSTSSTVLPTQIITPVVLSVPSTTISPLATSTPTAFEASTTTQIINVIATTTNISSSISFTRLPTKPLLSGSYLSFIYSYTNITSTTQPRINIFRELRDAKNKLLARSTGFRTNLKSGKNFNVSIKELLSLKIPPGVYTQTVTFTDSKGKRLGSEFFTFVVKKKK